MFYPRLFSRNWFGMASDIARCKNVRCIHTKHLIDHDSVVHLITTEEALCGQGTWKSASHFLVIATILP
jgi:hypothetical protein